MTVDDALGSLVEECREDHVGLWRLVVKLNNGTTETIVIVLR